MGEYLYRYVSFATFVDMIQTKSLNFVLPQTWSDPAESMFYLFWISQLSEEEKLFPLGVWNRIFAQCWTELDESDAMWRIYNYDSQSLRIKIRREDTMKLKGVIAKDVIYNDEPQDWSKLSLAEAFITTIAQKRTAFSHEKEVRLICIDDEGMSDVNDIIMAVLGCAGCTVDGKVIEATPERRALINVDRTKKNHKVSFSHVEHFIQGVLVNPLAPAWFVETVKEYCRINHIPFEGKSDLY